MTPRQHAVFEEARKGLSNKEIARNLGISEATVKLHLKVVFKELGVRSRWALLAEHGEVSSKAVPPPPPSDAVFEALSELLAEIIRLRACALERHPIRGE